MPKILTTANHSYSRHRFPGYKYRAKVKIRANGESFFTDIYTTDPDRESMENVLLAARHQSVTSITTVYCTTAEHDDKDRATLDDLFKFNL